MMQWALRMMIPIVMRSCRIDAEQDLSTGRPETEHLDLPAEYRPYKVKDI